MSNNKEGEYIPANSTERLSEQDIKLNELSEKLIALAGGFSNDAAFTIKRADSEVPEEPAEIDTESLAELKARSQLLLAVISEIEEVARIINPQAEHLTHNQE